MNKKFIGLFLIALTLTSSAMPAAFEPTDLHLLARLGKAALLKLVLDNVDVDLDAQDALGFTPLIYAAVNGHPECVKELLQRGADVNATDKKFGFTPLHMAISSNQTECVQELLTHGANVFAISQNLTPLGIAIARKNVVCINLLIKHNAETMKNVEITGIPALHFAIATQANFACLKTLIDHGANVYDKDNVGVTARNYASTGIYRTIEQGLSSQKDQKKCCYILLLPCI